MENEVKQRNLQRNRRRERAQRMQAQRESKVKDGDSGEDESPAREKPPRPPARRKKSREPLAEEDIIDGFAIMAFRTYEDLEAAVKCASSPRTNALSTKPRLPLAALASDTGRNHPTNNVNSHGITLLQDAGTSDDSGRASERLTGSSVAPRDPDSSRDRLSDASSRCNSSGKGYICDSEGDDDKIRNEFQTVTIVRIKDSPKSNAEDGSKKESKRKNNKQKTETNITKKKEKTARQAKAKDSQKRSPSKDAAHKASPDNSRNASPRYHDVSMEDASDAGSLFRVTSVAGGGGKNELVARGGSGGALALSRAPVGGSASPAPAPLPQPAPSPAPAALPPPALPPPHRPNGAHIPAMDGHAAAATQIPAKPVGAASGPDTPERPATNTSKLQPGARAAADSPTPAPPAPPAPSPLFPSHAAYQSQSHAQAALPDYRHTNHETRTDKPPDQPPPPLPPPAPRPHPPARAPLPAPASAPGPVPASAPDIEMRSPAAAPISTQPSSVPTSFPARANGVSPVTAPHSTPPAIPTCLPSQTLSGRSLSPAAPTSRPYPPLAIGSSHVNSSMSSSIHGHAMPPYPSQAILQKHSVQSVYASRPSHLAPFGMPPGLVPTGHATQPAPTHTSHSMSSHSIASHATSHHASHPLSHPHAMSAPTHLGPLPPATTSTLSSYSSSMKHPGLGPLAPPVPMHHTTAHVDLTTSSSNTPAVVTSSANSHPPLAPPVADSRQPAPADLPARTESPAIVSSGLATNGFPPPAVYSGAAYPPLYAPYATTLQHSPYLPPAAASPRNSADTRTSMSASPLVAPKTPKGVRPHTPGSTGAAGSALTSYSPGPSPTRERESFSNISSLSRSTPSSSAPTSSVPLAPSLIAPLAAPLPAPIAAPIPGQLGVPLGPPLGGPLAPPLGPPLTTPLAAPTPTPAAVVPSTHLPHTLAPVPTVPSISSSAKPPAHWGVTRPSPAEGPRGFAPAPPLFGAPLAPPPNPNPFSAESLFNTSPGADLLRRELDNRFLAVAGAAGAGGAAGPGAGAGAGVRTEMHHHQHQHTHVHQHPPPAPQPPPQPAHHPHHPHHLLVPHPPLFKDVSKMPSLYRSSMGLGYPYSSSLLHPPSPYVPPTPLSYAPTKPVVTAASDSAPKPPARPAVSKTGKWNAMHVRIAWEIYNHQHKEKAGGASLAPGPDKDKMRAFGGAPPHQPPPPPPTAYRSPYELPPHYLPHHPHLARYEPGPFAALPSHRAGVSPFARYPPAGALYPTAPPSFQLSAYGRELALSSSLHGVHHAPLPPLHDPWRSAPRPAAPPPPPSHAAAAAAADAAARRDHEERERERARREREERERRERDERERRKAREQRDQRDRELERARARSPLRNGVLDPKEERKEMPRHAGPPPLSAYPPPPAAAWDPYRAFDPLQHMRFAPLVEAAIRAEEDRAKMLSAYAHHQQMKASPLVRGAGGPLPPLGAHGLSLPPQLAPLAPLDLLKKEEPR